MDDVDAFIDKNGIEKYLSTSSKDGSGVNEAFRRLTESIAKGKGLI
jgi:hypothetical protein